MVGYTDDGRDRTSERPEGTWPPGFLSNWPTPNLKFCPQKPQKLN